MEDGLLNAVAAEPTEGECSEPKGAAGTPAERLGKDHS